MAAACILIGLFNPRPGALCAAGVLFDGIAMEYGYCTGLTVNSLSRPRVQRFYYRGGFCR